MELLKVTAIVPAYNEERTVGGVVKTLVESGVFHEVIVMDDGSSDKTAEAAESAGATKVLRAERNCGKGAAMASGVRASSAPIICFFDADLVGLSGAIIEELVRPVATGKLTMNIGTVDRGPFPNALAFRLPALSGQRAMRREVFEAVPVRHMGGYGIETALNYLCRVNKLLIGRVVLSGVSVVRKTQKSGWRSGLSGYVRMWYRVAERMIAVRLDRKSF